MDARRAQPGHRFQALDEGLWRVFDHQHVQIALRVGLAAGGGAEEDDALGLITLQGLQQGVAGCLQRAYLLRRRIGRWAQRRQGGGEVMGNRSETEAGVRC